MKCFPVFIIFLTHAFTPICLAASRSKNIEVTTLTLKNDTKKIYIKDKNNDFTEEFNKSVSLEIVVFSLLNQSWSKQEEACLNHVLELHRKLQNFTLWAVWEWDSLASQPQGLLFGNRYHLGNFDECLNPLWVPSRPELKTQYCLADIVLERTDNSVKKQHNSVDPDQSVLDYLEVHAPHTRPLNLLTWGVCVPASCGPRSVENLLRTMLARSHLGAVGLRAKITTGSCQKQGEVKAYDWTFWAFIVVNAVLVTTALVCTYYNNGRNKSDTKTLKYDIIEAFCIKTNATNLLKMQKDGVEVFYGIRFLSMCFIVTAHQYGLLNSGPISNGIQVDQDIHKPIGLLSHADLVVDSFFLLSGFLTAAIFSKIKKLSYPLLAILKRYIRIIPAYATVIFFITAVYPYTGTGPLWPKAIAGETLQCRRNWWLNLLMLNNYIDSENICLIVSWYIPCDFHFSCAAVILYWLYTHKPRIGLSCAVVVAVASVLVPGVLTYANDWIPIQLFTYEFVANPRGSPDFHRTYIKSHCRAAAYIVGFFSGFIFVKNRRTAGMRIPQKWAILGSISGLVVMFAIMFRGKTYLYHSYHPLEGAVYAALNRPAWAAALAMLVLCCSLGHVPLLKSFLSWFIWVPLSRLAYGLYLAHTLIIARGVFVTRNSRHNDYIGIFTASPGVIFWGCIAAFVIWLIIEAPAIRLFEVFVKRLLKKHTEAQNTDEQTGIQLRSVYNSPISCNYIDDNLPATVQFSPKV